VNLVLDTNVLVAALVARGVCGDLLEHCVRSHTLVSSSTLLEELREVLIRKFRQSDADARAAVGLFAETFMLVTPPVLDPCRDRDDDLVLATAVAGGCSAVITGDQDLLVLDPFQQIRILAPSAFWQWEGEQDR
jgi:putative PIN family toxin of toxin-antitoxin system